MASTTLTADDLLTSKGELELDWFSPLDLSAVSARLNEWLAEGFRRSDATQSQQVRDDTARAFAYFNAYNNIAKTIARKPKVFTVSEQNDTTSRTYTIEDAEFFKGYADSWWDVFLSLVPVAVESNEPQPSVSVKHRNRF